jgi:uncharacterized protein with HEPN domain
MNQREAEAVAALGLELDIALRLGAEVPDGLDDLRLQLAAERIVERIHQAAEAVDSDRREAYFGADGVNAMRGMRNRLAHNYLGVDPDVLWQTLTVDIPAVRRLMAQDLAEADAILRHNTTIAAMDENAWAAKHLRHVTETED